MFVRLGYSRRGRAVSEWCARADSLTAASGYVPRSYDILSTAAIPLAFGTQSLGVGGVLGEGAGGLKGRLILTLTRMEEPFAFCSIALENVKARQSAQEVVLVAGFGSF